MKRNERNANPEEKMNENTLVLMVGGPAAGKSTVRVAMFANLPVVDCDSFKESHPDYDPKNPAALHAWSSEQAMRAALANIATTTSFVYDSTGTNLDRMAMFVNVAHAAGMKVEAVFVACEVEEAVRRNAARERTVPETLVREKHAAVALAWPVLKTMVDKFTVVNTD